MIDGVFGTATRAALMAWQASNGRPTTTFFSNADASLLQTTTDLSQPPDPFSDVRQVPLASAEFLGRPITVAYKDVQIELAAEDLTSLEDCNSAEKQAVLFPSDVADNKLVCQAVVAKITIDAKNAQSVTIAVGDSSEEIARLHIKLSLQKLDAATSQPQIVITGYSGGAHCCTDFIIGSLGDNRDWNFVNPGQTDRGYAFLDLLHDGTSVIVSTDDGNFDYHFSSYAGSNPPTRIQKLTGLTIHDVTRELPYRSFLLRQIQSMQEKSARSERNGFLAGWVAEKALVGQLEDAWNTMLRSYDRSSTNGLSDCRVNEEVYVKTSLLECPESEEVDYSFPKALALYMTKIGYITREQSAELGYNIDYIEAERANETARYKEKMLTGWFVVTRDGFCSLARYSGSPADMVTADRENGLEDNISVLETDDTGKPIVVRIEQPKGNGLVSTVTFHRGFAKCEAMRLKREDALKNLK